MFKLPQLHSFHMLESNAQNSPSQASAIHEPWTSRCLSWFLEKAKEPEIKLPTSTGSWKSKRVTGKHLFLLYWLAKAFDCVDHNKLWKILQEMGIPEHLTCLLRNVYAGQEATVRTRHEITNWFQIGKGIHQGCIFSACLFNVYAEYIMWNARLEEAQLESSLLGELSITSDMQIHHPYGRKWRGRKESLDESERGV